MQKLAFDMGKIKLKKLGGSFSHAKSSTLWKTSNFIEYSDDSNLSISIDHFEPADYAWLHESKSIIPYQYQVAKDYHHQLKNIYKSVFTHDQELISLDPELFKFVPACGYWIENASIYEKTKLISFITSNKKLCPGHLIRHSLLDKYAKYCDVYGFGINPIDKKEQGLNNYMFSIVVENGVYDTYFTEKILDCFATGTIPVYLGTGNIIKFFDKDGIIFLDKNFDINYLNEELYKSKKQSIINNYNKVLNYNTVEDWMVLNKVI